MHKNPVSKKWSR